MDRHRLVTEQLDLNPITMADAERLAVLHADARVMNLLKHGVLSRSQSDALVADYEAEWPALGFGSWTACEERRRADTWSAWVGCASRTATWRCARFHPGGAGQRLRAGTRPRGPCLRLRHRGPRSRGGDHPAGQPAGSALAGEGRHAARTRGKARGRTDDALVCRLQPEERPDEPQRAHDER